jgi:hypothetical protein
MLQITEGGGVALSSGKEVFVNAQFFRARFSAHLGSLQMKEVMEPTLNSGRTDTLAFSQSFAADPIEVLPKDLSAKWFGAASTRQDCRKPLVEVPSACQAMVLQCLQMQTTMPHPPCLMAQLAYEPILLSQMFTPASRARYRPGIPGLYRHLCATVMDVLDLVAI